MRYLFFLVIIMQIVLTSSCRISTPACERQKVSGLYFPFDGAAPRCWQNQGTVCNGLNPSMIGRLDAPSVKVGEGLIGNSFDGSVFHEKQAGNCFQWGGGEQLDDYIEASRSFTITMWINCDPRADQGRLIKTPAFQVNCRRGFLELAFGKPGKWWKSDIARRFDVNGKWIFTAITYDCDLEQDNLQFYFGDSSEIYLNKSHNVPAGPLESCLDECFLVIGNSEYDGNRPFVGRIDELRLWFSKDKENSAALPQEELDEIRLYDLEEQAASAD
jgi:hypothetical protein